jgi:hypothetical protein
MWKMRNEASQKGGVRFCHCSGGVVEGIFKVSSNCRASTGILEPTVVSFSRVGRNESVRKLVSI